MSKFEWRKQCKNIYLPKKQPSFIEIPNMKYFTIEGSGNPDGDLFKINTETLYSLSYTIRMMPKKGNIPEGYFEYTVFPLEGIWDLDEVGRQLDYIDKDHLIYKLMIRQPDFVTEELFQTAKHIVSQKKSNLNLERVKFENLSEGLCVQAMHIGPYSNEPETFTLMERFCFEKNLRRIDKTHKEIYLSDPRKTSPNQLKTVLRFKVKELN